VRCAYHPWHASTHGFLQKMVTWHMPILQRLAT
jgi:hypothetical protein